MRKNRSAERRQFVRSAFGATVHATQIPRQFLGGDLELFVQDISEGGLRLFSPECFPVESELLLELELDAEAPQPPIRLVGKVMWVERISDQHRCQIGVEFSDLTDRSSACLRSLVAQQLQHS